MASTRKKSTTAKKKSSARSKTKSFAMTEMGHRPSHIVVFKQPDQHNLQFCTKSLNMTTRPGKSTRSGVKIIADAGRGGATRGYMYSRLGVFVGDLDEKSKSVFQESEAVAMVVPNQIRQIPKPVVATLPPSADYDRVLAAYLQGLRDASQAALNYLTSGTAPPLSGFPLPTQPPAPVAHPGAAAQGDYPFGLIGMTQDYTRFTGKNVTIAILDTGCDLLHDDFRNRVTENVNAVSFVPGESVQDEHGHGTHCTGIAAGPLNTHGRQRYGVAPDVDLLIGKVLDNTGTGSDDQIIDGIDWAIENGARIISMSLGSFRNAGTPYNALYETVASNILNNPQGALLVAAAGNDSARPFFTSAVNDPAAAPSIMAVAAVNQQRLVADFSNGALDNIGEVNLSAPGVAIYSAWTGNSFRSISGTSMATPMVAGVAALYLEQDPTLTPNQLWHALETHASVAGAIADFGKGLVQAP